MAEIVQNAFVCQDAVSDHEIAQQRVEILGHARSPCEGEGRQDG